MNELLALLAELPDENGWWSDHNINALVSDLQRLIIERDRLMVERDELAAKLTTILAHDAPHTSAAERTV